MFVTQKSIVLLAFENGKMVPSRLEAGPFDSITPMENNMAEANKQKAAEAVRKLTVKGIMGEKVDIEKLLAAPGKRMDLCDIFGIARRHKADQSEHGSFVRFYGRFKGVNLATGEVVEAPQFIAPGTVQDMLYGAMGTDENVIEVSFGVRIGVKFDNDAATKYVFTVTNLRKPSENDPLALLENEISTAVKALPAPQTGGEKKAGK